MFLPAFEEGSRKIKKKIIEFKGLNLGENYTDGQFEECRGISLDEYPCVTAGRDAKKVGNYDNITGVFERNGLIVVENKKLFYKEEYIGEVSDENKSFCGMNTKVVILPDKKYFDTAEKKIYELGNEQVRRAKFSAGEITVEEGVSGFSAGDGIHISGSKTEENNKSAIIREIKDNTLIFDEDIFTATEESEDITFERRIPDLKFMCEHGNRIWGVCGDTIYVSKLGDPTNFNVFDNLSTDSYAVAVATPGEFTAVAAFGNKVLFFKEDYIHIIYGTKPANYQLYTYNVPGVMKGAEKSIQIIDEVLYYKGVEGVYSYRGGVPNLISEVFGNERFKGGIAGKDGEVYFIQLTQNEKEVLFSYDTRRRVWLCEREGSIEDFVFSDGNLLFVSGRELYSYSFDNNSKLEWSITTKPLEEYTDEKKIYSSVFINYESDGVFRVFISRDGGEWEEIELSWKKGKKATFIPVNPQRCNSFKIKLCGKGRFKIKSITREFDIGGDER